MALTKKQERSIAEIRRLISLKSCGAFSMPIGYAEGKSREKIAESIKQRVHSYLTTWVEIELLKIEGKLD